MSDAATPAENNGGTPPATPAATPAPAAPAAAATPETVTLTKAEHDQLAKDAARASGNQRKADLFDRMNGKGHFRTSQPNPAAPAPAGDPAEAGAEEDRKAARGLTALALDPAYREVLDKDPTLRDLLGKNPLAVLPIYASDALDAEDAVGLVKGMLDSRKTPAPANLPPTPPVTPPATPPPGAVNPPGDAMVNAEVTAALKEPNTERAIAGSIGARLKGMKK